MADWPPPEAAFGRLPPKGATLADRQSRIRGVHLLKVLRHG
jgi:hypothetical protein